MRKLKIRKIKALPEGYWATEEKPKAQIPDVQMLSLSLSITHSFLKGLAGLKTQEPFLEELKNGQAYSIREKPRKQVTG